MADPRLPDYTRLVPTTAPQDREVDLDHAAPRAVPTSGDGALHFGNGPAETACGKPRGQLAVTDHRAVFAQTKAGHLTAYPRVCDACDAATEGGGGPYRTKR